MRHVLPILTCFALVAVAAAPVRGQLAPAEPGEPDEATPTPPQPPPESDAVAFRVEKPRPLNNKILVGSLFGGAVLMGGLGLAFHLDSRTKSDEVSKAGDLSGEVWTAERRDTYDSAVGSRNFAIGFYAVGTALLTATIVTFIVTEPGEEVVTYGATPGVTPTFVVKGDSAMLGAAWSFQ